MSIFLLTFIVYIYFMKILHLTLKKQWFDMIASGEKPEEYREIKDYWYTRLFDVTGKPIRYDIVRFRNGYSSSAPTMDVEYKGVKIGIGKSEWGAPKEDGVYKIMLGRTIGFVNYIPTPHTNK